MHCVNDCMSRVYSGVHSNPGQLDNQGNQSTNRHKLAWKHWKCANISICRLHWVVLLIFKCNTNRNCAFYALNLSFWGHGHVGLFFTNEEQKMARDAFDTLPHISPLALFMTSLIQTAGHKWHPSLSCFVTFQHQCFSKQDQEIKWNAAVHDLCCSISINRAWDTSVPCFPSKRIRPSAKLSAKIPSKRIRPSAKLSAKFPSKRIRPSAKLSAKYPSKRIRPSAKLSAKFSSKRIRPLAKFPSKRIRPSAKLPSKRIRPSAKLSAKFPSNF